MIDNDLLKARVRSSFRAKFEDNKELMKVYDRIAMGTADHLDAELFAEEVGKMLTNTFGKYIENVDDVAVEIVNEMLDKGCSLVSAVCDGVQYSLNDSAGIGLGIAKPKRSISERNLEIINAFRETVEPERIPLVLSQNEISTNLLKVVDDYVQSNAEFQSKAGLSPVIVRVWSGSWPSHDTKHNDWCQEIAGTYEYGQHPRNVFLRHKGCRCKVLYYPDKNSKGRITALAKGEKDDSKELWNTGKEFSQSRSAQLRRRREKLGKETARKILNEEWKGGRNGLAERRVT